MMRYRPGWPSPTLVMSVIPRIIALGGTGYAAIRLLANSVGDKQLENAANSTNTANLAREAGL